MLDENVEHFKSITKRAANTIRSDRRDSKSYGANETACDVPRILWDFNTIDNIWNWRRRVIYHLLKDWAAADIRDSLNLTQANRIHIVEPQWNPTVEAQAIGRALRLGQTREVIVFRYVMDGTIEQVCFSLQSLYFADSSFYNILEFQKKKDKLAKLALKGGLEESPSEKLQVSLATI